MKTLLCVCLFAGFFTATFAQNLPDDLAINEIQVIASHNSYRTLTHKGVYRTVKLIRPFLPKKFDPRAWDYSHLPLSTQLDSFGIRGLELDVYYDPQGGKYYKRRGKILALQSPKSRVEKLKQPGFKILHIPDLDFNTHYITFQDALQELKQWSEAHPDHSPVFVQVEVKNSSPGSYTKFKFLPKIVPFNQNAADSLDAEVRTVFGENLAHVMTPDQFRNQHESLDAAVKAGDIPSLASARGKIFFILHGCQDIYMNGHPALKDRSMFVYSKPHSPECAFIIVDDAINNQDSIKKWVKEGYMIRTRCDEGTFEARKGDYTRQKAAFESGAQILSTDYYRPDPRHKKKPKKWSSYQTLFPDGSHSRRNVVVKE